MLKAIMAAFAAMIILIFAALLLAIMTIAIMIVIAYSSYSLGMDIGEPTLKAVSAVLALLLGAGFVAFFRATDI